MAANANVIDDAYRSNRPMMAEAILDDDGKAPCDPPDGCPTCVLFTNRRPGETRSDWHTRLRDGAFGVPTIAPVVALRAPEVPMGTHDESQPPGIETIDRDALRIALAALRDQEKALARQLLKARGGIEAIQRLLSVPPAPGAAAPVVATLRPEPPEPVLAVETDPPLRKRWSRLYDRCQDPDCRSPQTKHASRGLCANCYMRARYPKGSPDAR